MSVQLNSVDFVLEGGWRDATTYSGEITQDLLDGYGKRRAITNLINLVLQGNLLAPEEQNSSWFGSQLRATLSLI